MIIRNFIKPIDCFSPRLYMKLYNSYLRNIGVILNGTPRYIHPSVKFDGKGYKNTFIGHDVVISRDVLLLNHDFSIACGFRAINRNNQQEAFWIKDIKIGNNVFIGANASILPGTIIGDNCIIGTAAVIKGTIPENSVVIGNPAQIKAKTTDWALKQEQKADYFFE